MYCRFLKPLKGIIITFIARLQGIRYALPIKADLLSTMRVQVERGVRLVRMQSFVDEVEQIIHPIFPVPLETRLNFIAHEHARAHPRFMTCEFILGSHRFKENTGARRVEGSCPLLTIMIPRPGRRAVGSFCHIVRVAISSAQL